MTVKVISHDLLTQEKFMPPTTYNTQSVTENWLQNDSNSSVILLKDILFLFQYITTDEHCSEEA